VVLPTLWTHYEHQPGLADLPMVTRTGSDIPGDPINVGLVGDKADIVAAIHRAGWHPADPITLKTSAEIVGSVVLDRPYLHAPVSNLFYDGRKQDLAFESPAGGSADRRNHVRLWLVLEKGLEGRPVWLGSATFDSGSGLSHFTGQITHHIAPDIDAERDNFIGDLVTVRMVSEIYSVSGIGPTINGRNGGGDRYFTDGEVDIAVITRGAQPTDAPPAVLPRSPPVAFKDLLFSTVEGFLGPVGEPQPP
jgi:hypothetical protein